MGKQKKSGFADPTSFAPTQNRELVVVIETPKGSRNKSL